MDLPLLGKTLRGQSTYLNLKFFGYKMRMRKIIILLYLKKLVEDLFVCLREEMAKNALETKALCASPFHSGLQGCNITS